LTKAMWKNFCLWQLFCMGSVF